MSDAPGSIDVLHGALGEARARYQEDAPDERPLAGYTAVSGAYVATIAALALAMQRSGRRFPDRIDPADLALMAVATHKISRIIAKDSVTSAVRAPFTQFEEATGASEVNERVREGRFRHAVGELLTCPFCLDVWVATAFGTGMVVSPRATRWVASVFTTVAASDALHFAYDALKQTES